MGVPAKTRVRETAHDTFICALAVPRPLVGLGLHLLQLAFFLSLISVDPVPQEPAHGTAIAIAALVAVLLAAALSRSRAPAAGWRPGCVR